jgi:hypothetical protein
MSGGVSRQGGPGIGGGAAAGRHRAISQQPVTSIARTALECIQCGRPVTTTTMVVESGRLFCVDCVPALDLMVPGQYLG